MRPASGDAPSLVGGVLEPFEQGLEASRALRADNASYLARRERRGLDQETKDLLTAASRSATAPASLRTVAAEVEAGRLTWDEVMAGRGGPVGAAFLAEAHAVARERFEDDSSLAQVEVPEEAVELAIDPAAVREETARTLDEARDAHDALWRESLL